MMLEAQWECRRFKSDPNGFDAEGEIGWGQEGREWVARLSQVFNAYLVG
jgi:hypothetical protein